MTGKSHITMNMLSMGAVADTIFVLQQRSSDTIGYMISENVKNFLLNNGTFSVPVFYIVSILLYCLGAILPDIDYPYSPIGKVIHLPFEHRTWTHAIWIPAILCIAGIFIRPLFYLGLGMLLHDFWDCFSASGIHWFYPIKNKHHFLTLYKSSHFSEYVFVFIFLLLFGGYTACCLQQVYHIL